jgi:hypothetical protein
MHSISDVHAFKMHTGFTHLAYFMLKPQSQTKRLLFSLACEEINTPKLLFLLQKLPNHPTIPDLQCPLRGGCREADLAPQPAQSALPDARTWLVRVEGERVGQER